MNLIQVDANYAHFSKIEIGIEIGSLEDELSHKMERDGMTKNSWILMRTWKFCENSEFHDGRV